MRLAHALSALAWIAAANAQVGLFLEQSPPGGTPARLLDVRFALAFDPGRQRAVQLDQVNSNTNVTWEYDGSAWTLRAGVTTPLIRGARLAYDTIRGRIVAVGAATSGSNVLQTWDYDGTSWLQTASLTTVSGQPPSIGGMAFDTARGALVLYGGAPNGGLSPTWERVGTTWSLRTIGGPPARDRTALVFDPIRAVCVLYGGIGETNYFNDTWEWNGTFWLQRLVSGPGPRYASQLAFDPARNRTWVFGGSDGSNELSDVWEWDGTAWTQMQVRLPPANSTNTTTIAFPPLGSILLLGWSSPVSVPATFLYRVHPQTVGSLVATGVGCGTPPLQLGAGTAVPLVGETLQVQMTNIPTGAVAIGAIGFDRTQWLGVPLPAPLDAAGFPGCTAYLAPEQFHFVPSSGGVGSWSIDVPPWHAFVGLQFALQAVAYAPGLVPGGLVFGNALFGQVGIP